MEHREAVRSLARQMQEAANMAEDALGEAVEKVAEVFAPFLPPEENEQKYGEAMYAIQEALREALAPYMSGA